MCTNSWEGSGSLECVMERWEETHDLSELLLLRQIFHSFCFFTETKRNHTNHRRLKCQGLQRVPCSLFGRRFFFFFFFFFAQTLFYLHNLCSQHELCAFTQTFGCKKFLVSAYSWRLRTINSFWIDLTSFFAWFLFLPTQIINISKLSLFTYQNISN